MILTRQLSDHKSHTRIYIVRAEYRVCPSRGFVRALLSMPRPRVRRRRASPLSPIRFFRFIIIYLLNIYIYISTHCFCCTWPALFNRRRRAHCCLRSETHHRGHQEPAQNPDPGRGPVQHSGRQHGGRHSGTADDADRGAPGRQAAETASQGPVQPVPARNTKGKTFFFYYYFFFKFCTAVRCHLNIDSRFDKDLKARL